MHREGQRLSASCVAVVSVSFHPEGSRREALVYLNVETDIPVSFDYNGKHCNGHFSAPSGAGGKTWHLTIDGYYRGQLILTENFGWQFSNNQDTMTELTDYFAAVIIAWYQ